MKWIVIAAAFINTSAWAHVEPGTYKGVNAEGKECSMTAGKTYFENNARHPLNERIDITVDGQTFKVGHPPVIDSSQALVFFNHDLFQGIFPTATGAKAVEIEMVHSAEFEGPKSFTFLENFWQEKRRVSYQCKDLKLTK